MTLNLSPQLETRLSDAARREGLPADEYVIRVLERAVASPERRAAAVGLLQSWIDAPDPQEQIAAGQYLVAALDADRLSDRKLFPPELKGVTW